jgi:hypothetical protein
VEMLNHILSVGGDAGLTCETPAHRLINSKMNCSAFGSFDINYIFLRNVKIFSKNPFSMNKIVCVKEN